MGCSTIPIVSLLDMQPFLAGIFLFAAQQINGFDSQIEAQIKRRGRDSPLTPMEVRRIRSHCKTLETQCERLQIKRTLERLSRIEVKFIEATFNSKRAVSLEQIRVQIQELRQAIVSDLNERTFMYVSPEEAQFYEQGALFGKEIAERFPQANQEITSAGNCFATGNNTACVFHLMRSIEITARIMVDKLRVRKYLDRPVVLCDWGDLTRALDKGVEALAQGKRKSLSKTETFEFYNHAVSQFRNFKNAWRNNVSHTRKVYGAGETKDIIDNTRQFMTHLAMRLREPRKV